MFGKIKDKLRQNYGKVIQVSFVIIALLYGSLYFIYPHISTGDNIINFLRLKDVSVSLAHGHLPQFSWYTGTFLGGAINSFYPWEILLPLIPFLYIMSPIHWWGLIICVGMLVGLEVTYFSVRTLHKSRKQTLLITLFYCLSTVPAFEAYWGEDFGYFYALFLAPIAIIGWLHWLRHGRWHMMVFGMILIAFTHIATTVILGMSLVLMTLCFYKKFSVPKLINGLKAIGTFLVCSSFMWLPLVYLRMTNQIDVPNIPFPASIQPLFLKSWYYYLTPLVFNTWDVIDLLAVILGFIYYRYLRSIDKKFLFFSLVILFINIKPIEWFLVYHTFFSNFQFLFRFSFISHFFLSCLLGQILCYVLPQVWKQKTINRLIKGVLIFMVLILGLGILEKYIALSSRPQFHNTFNFQRDYRHNHFLAGTYDDHDLESTLYTHDLYISYADYYPYATIEFRKGFSHPFLKFEQPNKDWYTNNNEIKMNIKRSGSYHVPAVMYNGQKYEVTVNHKSVHPRNENHYMVLPLHRGKNVISFHTPIMWYRQLALSVTIIGTIALISWTIFEKKKRRKRDKETLIE